MDDKEKKLRVFLDEKKNTITALLDAAVTHHGLDVEDYLRIKSDLLHKMEAEESKKVGLYEFISEANKLAGECLGLDDLNIVVDAAPALPDDKVTRKAHLNVANNLEPELGVTKASLSSGEGKAKLLKYLSLLPPYLDRSKLPRYESLIESKPEGPVSEAAEIKTTGDVEYQIMGIVRESFQEKFGELVKRAPSAFYDEIVTPGGKKKRHDVAPSLSVQIGKCMTMRQFLATKDLIARHVAAYREKKKKARNSESRFKFWK